MVRRIKKRSRKYLGNRRWGRGNIKNGRGAGDRGGVGKGGKKHKFTRVTAKTPWLIRRKGFTSIKVKYREIDLREISKLLKDSNSKIIELPYYKVLSNGELELPAEIRASAFSKKAIEKIEKANGKAVEI
ncbi:MAG: 50S ribosomal protein L15 [Candidatus Micrarchaeota archaeon]|nr:MAG: 50S ribosomal protein L15 [Candidatus Micrarchaeota archaeon]